MKLFRISLLSLSTLFLAGCATFFKQTPTTPTCGTASKTQLEALTNWTISGALAVTSQSIDQRNVGGNALFNWQQEGKQYTLEIFGPFGINRIRLLGSPEKVTLFGGPQTVYTASTPEVLLQEQLGWSVPISHLLYWVRGLPVPHTRVENEIKNPNGSFSQFTQDGWIIRYLDYTQIGCLLLPSKLSMQHPTLQTRFVIRQWKIP